MGRSRFRIFSVGAWRFPPDFSSASPWRTCCPEVAFHDHDRGKLTATFLLGIAIAIGVENLPGHDHTSHDHTSHDHTSHDHTSHDHTSHDHTSHDHTSHDHTSHDHTSHDRSPHKHSHADHDH